MAQGLVRNRIDTHCTPDGTPERDGTGAETTYLCPLCGGSTGASSDLYVHLQTSHRKSALAGMVLDVSDCTATGSE